MTDFLIKSTTCMGILLGVYYLFMQNERMHTFKRFYLLFSLLTSLVLPFITVNRYYEIEQVQTVSVQPIVTEIINTTPATSVIENIDYTPYLLLSLYCLIALIMAVRFIMNVTSLYKKAKQRTIILHEGAKLVLLEDSSDPHTFLNYIFISKQEYEDRIIENELFIHELAHVKQKHTLDILFIETLKIVFWFNPLLYLYKKAIQLNHEFLADEEVVIVNKDVPYYQNLLLTRASGSYIPLTSSINFSITKNRFLMMTKNKRKSIIAIKQLLTVPVTAALFAVLCINNVPKATAANLQQQTTITAQGEDPIALDKRRDSYYAGVRMIIEDKRNNTTIDKPYEELTLKQKRDYLFYVPTAKVKKSPTAKELEDYKNKSKYAIWIDGKNVDNTALNKYKNTDIAYVTGSSVYKNARTKQHPQPYQFNLYTQDYFDKNLKNSHLKYPEKIFTLKVSDTKKTAAVESNRDSKTASLLPDRIDVTTPTKSELDSLQKTDPVKYKGKEADFLKTKITYAEKNKKSDISYDKKHDYTVNLSGPIPAIDPNKMKAIEINQLTEMEKKALYDHDPKMYNDLTIKDYVAIKVTYINDDGRVVSETTYEKKPKM